MNLFGVGPMELLFLLLIALLILGPSRMVSAARTLGKYLREFQRAASEVPRLISLDAEDASEEKPSRQQLPSQPPAQQEDASGPAEEPWRTKGEEE